MTTEREFRDARRDYERQVYTPRWRRPSPVWAAVCEFVLQVAAQFRSGKVTRRQRLECKPEIERAAKERM
ncbi:MAG: hypothetical protein DI587_31365 [Variovorax paradoxus]|nr:MAG: hypothetical protein DI583_31365 [Variovorax paradoxus]PZQ03160.1 MAG: hypothetical protein DI587_31365 [Variovorax paradoxus]